MTAPPSRPCPRPAAALPAACPRTGLATGPRRSSASDVPPTMRITSSTASLVWGSLPIRPHSPISRGQGPPARTARHRRSARRLCPAGPTPPCRAGRRAHFCRMPLPARKRVPRPDSVAPSIARPSLPLSEGLPTGAEGAEFANTSHAVLAMQTFGLQKAAICQKDRCGLRLRPAGELRHATKRTSCWRMSRCTPTRRIASHTPPDRTESRTPD